MDSNKDRVFAIMLHEEEKIHVVKWNEIDEAFKYFKNIDVSPLTLQEVCIIVASGEREKYEIEFNLDFGELILDIVELTPCSKKIDTDQLKK